VILGNIMWKISTNVTNTIFVGHLAESADSLSGAALGTMFTNVTGNSLAMGLTSGIDTLGGQSWGQKSYRKVGLILQRSIAIRT